MTEPSSALYDFAIATWADADLGMVPPLVAELRRRHPQPPPQVELLGRPETGEILILLRFGFAHYSTGLRQKLATEAGRLNGRLIEVALLSPEERNRFYGERLAGFPVHADASAEEEPALASFRDRMGLTNEGAAIELHFDSADDVAAAWGRTVATGRLFVPSPRAWPAGSQVRLALLAKGLTPLSAMGTVLEAGREEGRAGFFAQVSPSDGLGRFLARQHTRERAGRVHEARGQRAHPRVEACLDVSFEASATLREEYTTNIGRGGLFVHTEHPPPLRSFFRLRLKLPDGPVAETQAEVAHLVTVEEAKLRRIPPGVGVAFAVGDTLFQRCIGQFLESCVARKPRVLVADDDRLLREVLEDALGGAGCEVDLAADGDEAMKKIAARLFALDAIVIDLVMPGLDGFCLIERVRRLGGESDLKIVVLSGSARAEELKGLGGADEVIEKGTPIEEIVQRIGRLLGR